MIRLADCSHSSLRIKWWWLRIAQNYCTETSVLFTDMGRLKKQWFPAGLRRFPSASCTLGEVSSRAAKGKELMKDSAMKLAVAPLLIIAELVIIVWRSSGNVNVSETLNKTSLELAAQTHKAGTSSKSNTIEAMLGEVGLLNGWEVLPLSPIKSFLALCRHSPSDLFLHSSCKLPSLGDVLAQPSWVTLLQTPAGYSGL